MQRATWTPLAEAWESAPLSANSFGSLLKPTKRDVTDLVTLKLYIHNPPFHRLALKITEAKHGTHDSVSFVFIVMKS